MPVAISAHHVHLTQAAVEALFGAGHATDAFNIAFRIPNLLRDLFAEGAMSAAFVPTFTQYLVRGSRREAYDLGSLVLTTLLGATGSVALLGIVAAEPSGPALLCGISVM